MVFSNLTYKEPFMIFFIFPREKQKCQLEGSNNKNKDASFMISGKECTKGNGLINGQPKIDPDSLNNVRIIRKESGIA